MSTLRSTRIVELWSLVDRALRTAHQLPGKDQSEPKVLELFQRYAHVIQELRPQLGNAGILTAGFTFENPASGATIFFQRGSTTAATLASNLQTPYVFHALDEARRSGAEQAIQEAFLWVRRQQLDRAAVTKRGGPEFIRCVPSLEAVDRGSIGRFEGSFRKKFGIHYCSATEVALGVAAYALLQSAVLAFGADASGECLLDWRPTTLEGLPLVYQGPHSASLELESLDRLPGKGSWRTLLQRRLSSWENFADALSRSTSIPSGELVGLLRQNPKLGLSGTDLQSHALQYLFSLTKSAPHAALGTIAHDFEDSSRFPFIPYLMWMMIDPTPRAHFIAPIWTVLNNAVLGAKKSPGLPNDAVVGWALVASHPLDTLEKSFLEQGDEDHAEVVLTQGVLSLIARPAISAVYYANEIAAAESARRFQYISSIMSRNLSHNIGSHVLHHVVHTEGGDDISALTRTLFSYIQERMDYIALISSAAPSWEAPSNLKAAFRPFETSDGLLMRNIIRSQLPDPPRVEFRDELAASHVQNEDEDEVHTFTTVALPHGVVGRQALYAILENLIRNSAKHAHLTKSADHLRYVVTLKDVRETGKDGVTYTPLEFVDNMMADEATVAQLNTILHRPIYEAADPIASSRNWGIKEIRISASFLAGRMGELFQDEMATTIGDRHPTATYFLAGSHDNPSLGFRVWLREPAGALIICREQRCIALREACTDRLVSYATPAELEDYVGTGRLGRFEIVVVDVEDLYSEDFGAEMVEQLNWARRIGVVGARTGPVMMGAYPTALVASNWGEVETRFRASKGTGVCVDDLCTGWATSRWPDKKILTIADRHEETRQFRFKELVATADIAAEQPLRLENEQLADAAGMPIEFLPRRTLVFDHTRYRDGLVDNDVFAKLKQAAYYAPIKHPMNLAYSSAQLRWRLLESCSLRVAVFDERIAGSCFVDERTRTVPRAAGDPYDKWPENEDSIATAWARVGVDIMDDRILDIERDEFQSIGTAVTGVKLTDSRGYDFIVVHRSLLTKRIRQKGERHRGRAARQAAFDAEKTLNRRLSSLRHFGKRIVLVSGAGRETRLFSDSMQRSIRQIEFTALREAIFATRLDKARLSILLTSL